LFPTYVIFNNVTGRYVYSFKGLGDLLGLYHFENNVDIILSLNQAYVLRVVD